MNENIENVVKIETKGFQDLCNHIRELEEKNKQLENENKTLKEENTYFKARNLALAKRFLMSSSKPIFLKQGMSVVVDSVEMSYEDIRESKIDSLLCRKHLEKLMAESE